jgi:hypothetical protein
MKIIDKPTSISYLIECGCGKTFEHKVGVRLVYCISCGLKGDLNELTKEEPKKEVYKEVS